MDGFTCPCSDFAPSFQLPGPDGAVYAVEIYVGCEACGTGPGVALHRFDDRKAARDWSVPELPRLTFDVGDGVAFLQVLDPDKLREGLKEWLGEVDEDDEDDPPQDPLDLWDDFVSDRGLVDAAVKTYEASMRLREERRKRAWARAKEMSLGGGSRRLVLQFALRHDLLGNPDGWKAVAAYRAQGR